jgi:peptidoglycan/LPS O-acetylase OafA/YrhL
MAIIIPMTQPSINRIESLDWLRGLMAISIMLYHYVSWEFAVVPIGTVLGKLGIYAVSIFFILSGLSLALVYGDYIKGVKSSIFFLVRRVFRIWPVLWIAVAIFVVASIYNQKPIDFYTIVLNLTTLFGFIDPSRYISDGAWSIGNEMVYYAMTPVVILLYNRKLLYGNIFFIFAIIVGLFFSFSQINSQSTLVNEWNNYINPFNNLFLFISGIALYYNLKGLIIKKEINFIFLSMVVLLFVFVDVRGDAIAITTGINRIFFSAFSIAAVLLFWKSDFDLPKPVKKPWTNICLAAYPIYLLHPFILEITKIATGKIMPVDPFFIISFSVAVTILVSIIIYKFIEKPFIRLGKKLTLGEDIASNQPVCRALIIVK